MTCSYCQRPRWVSFIARSGYTFNVCRECAAMVRLRVNW